jgi:hypothetical protein
MVFGLFSKQKGDRGRQKAQQTLAQIGADLRSGDQATQATVDQTIQRAYSRFIQRFESLDRYKTASPTERQQYVELLAAFENRTRNKQHDAEVIGLVLFKWWLSAADDEELRTKFVAELPFLGNKAHFGVMKD